MGQGGKGGERGITYKKYVEGNSLNYSNKFFLVHKKRIFITKCDLCNSLVIF